MKVAAKVNGLKQLNTKISNLDVWLGSQSASVKVEEKQKLFFFSNNPDLIKTSTAIIKSLKDSQALNVQIFFSANSLDKLNLKFFYAPALPWWAEENFQDI